MSDPILLFDGDGNEIAPRPERRDYFAYILLCGAVVFLCVTIPLLIVRIQTSLGLGAAGVVSVNRSHDRPYGDQAGEPVEITSGEIRRVFDQALADWRTAIGPLPIAKPKLFGVISCGSPVPPSIACAENSTNRVLIVRGSLGCCDLKSVFMHEIGHLLGVPHIEDDPLMDPAYHAGIEKPSPYAVALAKIAPHGVAK